MVNKGRGISVYMTPDGTPGGGYTLTGRSLSSQARELIEGKLTHTIRTEVPDPQQLEQGSPALLIYPAVAPVNGALVLSNGAQTGLVFSVIERNRVIVNPADALREVFAQPVFVYDKKDDRWIDLTTYEPDAPNNTPRITACLMGGRAAIHIVWCGKDGTRQEAIYDATLEPGKGKLITTYDGTNANPLQPFVGEPRDITMGSDDVGEICQSFYDAIAGGEKQGENWRVAAAAVLLRHGAPGGLETKVLNRSKFGS